MNWRKHESKCTKHPKHKPYGTKGTSPYCNAHDCHMNYSISKSGERQKAKREIENGPKEPEYDPIEYDWEIAECSYCGGDGITEGKDPCWDEGELVTCPNCCGSGLAKDMTFW